MINFNNTVECPYCHKEFDLADYDDYTSFDEELLEEGVKQVECPECGMPFFVQTNISYSFHSSMMGDDDD